MEILLYVGEILKGMLVVAIILGFVRYVAGPGRMQELVNDSQTGLLSPTKMLTSVASMTFTLKMLGMLPKAPTDPLLWLMFMATVGGVEIAKKILVLKRDTLELKAKDKTE